MVILFGKNKPIIDFIIEKRSLKSNIKLTNVGLYSSCRKKEINYENIQRTRIIN